MEHVCACAESLLAGVGAANDCTNRYQVEMKLAKLIEGGGWLDPAASESTTGVANGDAVGDDSFKKS